jgi:hypothetical protein
MRLVSALCRLVEVAAAQDDERDSDHDGRPPASPPGPPAAAPPTEHFERLELGLE